MTKRTLITIVVLLMCTTQWGYAETAYQPGPLLRKALAGPMSNIDDIVFAVRVSGRDHWYVNFGNYSDDSTYARQRAFKKEDGVYWGYGEGGRLCRFNLRTGRLNVLLDDPKGGVRDPQVHYDGKKILFSYRKGGTHAYHLYEINIDGTKLKQLTDGPDDDIEPTYLPGGGIMFVSSRCRRFVNCWYSRVGTLYLCDGDGKNIRMVSTNNDHDNTPWVMPDGRVLYMRWEYVDRSQLDYHHLWTVNPDGTGQMVYFGNMNPGTVMLDAKPVAGTGKVVASFSPGHGRNEHIGHVGLIDPSGGPDQKGKATIISKRDHYRDPYAMSEDCFLAVDYKGIVVMDGNGDTEWIYKLPPTKKGAPALACHEPRPLRSRPREPVIASRVQLDQPTGKMILADVHTGRNMTGLKKGEIKKLLVLEQLPKPVNFSGGMQPLTIFGSFTMARVLGTVPVDPDGSAYMEVPALRSLFFVALDENDLSVKRMQSFVTVAPGETVSCTGCHEQRTQTASTGVPKLSLSALQRKPSPIEPITNAPDVFDFPRDIQPILDRHCVKCHNPDRWEGKVDLTGDHTARFSMSYWSIYKHHLVADGGNRPVSNLPPRSIGSSASRLMKLIDGSHYDAKVTDHERDMIRLWIESSAVYPGTYAALGSGMVSPHWPVGRMRVRCGNCHGIEYKDRRGQKHFRFRFGKPSRHGQPYTNPDSLGNLTRPEKSPLLRAPLAKQAGGLGMCKGEVFANIRDPDYQLILSAITAASKHLQQIKRFDMPGFRPNRHYIREMQRFGFLPKDLGESDPVDPYKTDQAYWESFWYRPRVEERKQ